MEKEDIRKKRLELLYQIDKLQEGCVGCVIHYEMNKLKDITALTNACKACPLGQKIGAYGEQLLSLTSPRKKLSRSAE